jgi:hypothetical protein
MQSADEISILHSPEAVFLDGYHAEKQALEERLERSIHIGDSPAYTSARTVRRCLEVSKMTEDDCNSLAQHSHNYLNTFALRTLGYKNLLGSLNHPYVPKTLEVTPDNYLLFTDNKEGYVVKPTEGCEGNGIYFGRDFSSEAWEGLLEEISTQHYVAQEFIELSTRSVELYRDGTIHKQEFFFDLCPYFFIKQGRVIGNGHTLVRFSTEPIVNVSKGGGIGYHTRKS